MYSQEYLAQSSSAIQLPIVNFAKIKYDSEKKKKKKITKDK